MLLLSNVRRIIGSGRLIVIDILVYSFICGTNLQLAKETGMTCFEYVLHCISNHYFILYFLLIAYMLIITRYLRQTQDIQIVRYVNKKRWMRIELLSLLLFSILFSGIHLTIPYVIGILKLPFSAGFTVSAKTDVWSEMMDLLIEYGKWFSSSVIASICVCLFLAIGLWLISIVLRKVLTEYGMIAVLILMGGIVINTFVGLKTSMDDVAFPLFINKYLILHHALFSNGWIGVLLIVCVPCVLFFLFSFNLRPLFKKGRAPGNDERPFIMISLFSRANMKRMTGIVLLYCLINAVSLMFIEKAPGVADYFLYMFIGGSGKSITIRDLLSYIFMIGIPIYFIAVYEEKIRTYHSTPLLIRYGEISRLENAIRKAEVRFLLMYFLILLSSIFLSGGLLSLKTGLIFGRYIDDYAGLLGKGLPSAVFLLNIGIVVRLAELFLVTTIFRLIRSLTENTSLSFVIALSGYLLLLIPLRFISFLPYGAGSLTRIAECFGGNGVAPYLIIVLISCTIALITRRSIGRKGVRK